MAHFQVVAGCSLLCSPVSCARSGAAVALYDVAASSSWCAHAVVMCQKQHLHRSSLQPIISNTHFRLVDAATFLIRAASRTTALDSSFLQADAEHVGYAWDPQQA
jgi:hypothetical protein